MDTQTRVIRVTNPTFEQIQTTLRWISQDVEMVPAMDHFERAEGANASLQIVNILDSKTNEPLAACLLHPLSPKVLRIEGLRFLTVAAPQFGNFLNQLLKEQSAKFELVEALVPVSDFNNSDLLRTLSFQSAGQVELQWVSCSVAHRSPCEGQQLGTHFRVLGSNHFSPRVREQTLAATMLNSPDPQAFAEPNSISGLAPPTLQDQKAESFWLVDGLDSEETNFGKPYLGEPVGLAQVEIDCRAARLSYLGLIPAARGKGCGSFLLSHIMDVLHQRGVETLLTMVGTTNQPAMRLYARQGFHLYRTYNLYRRRLPRIPS